MLPLPVSPDLDLPYAGVWLKQRGTCHDAAHHDEIWRWEGSSHHIATLARPIKILEWEARTDPVPVGQPTTRDEFLSRRPGPYFILPFPSSVRAILEIIHGELDPSHPSPWITPVLSVTVCNLHCSILQSLVLLVSFTLFLLLEPNNPCFLHLSSTPESAGFLLGPSPNLDFQEQ